MGTRSPVLSESRYRNLRANSGVVTSGIGKRRSEPERRIGVFFFGSGPEENPPAAAKRRESDVFRGFG
jgi:hypothetical protein